jgi:hypothetical protein
LFRDLLLQIGGANIENPPSSSSLAEERRTPGARFPTLAAALSSCSKLIAPSAWSQSPEVPGEVGRRA